MTEPQSESIRALREVAQELKVTDRQLRRWRTEGLLPNPINRRGYGRAKGSETFYPLGTCDQLRAVVECFNHDRRVEEVKWAMWCHGFDVLPEWVEFLPQGLVAAQDEVRAQLAASEEGHRSSLLDTIEARHPLPPDLRSAGISVKREDFAALYSEGLTSVAGLFEGFMPITADELWPTLQGSAAAVGGEPLSEEMRTYRTADFQSVLNHTIRVFDYDAIERYIGAAPNQLTRVRDEALRLAQLAGVIRPGVAPFSRETFMTVLMTLANGIRLTTLVEYMLEVPAWREAGQRFLHFMFDSSRANRSGGRFRNLERST